MPSSVLCLKGVPALNPAGTERIRELDWRLRTFATNPRRRRSPRKQHGHRTGGIARGSQIRDAITVEVCHGGEDRIFTHGRTRRRSEASVPLAQKNSYRI